MAWSKQAPFEAGQIITSDSINVAALVGDACHGLGAAIGQALGPVLGVGVPVQKISGGRAAVVRCLVLLEREGLPLAEYPFASMQASGFQFLATSAVGSTYRHPHDDVAVHKGPDGDVFAIDLSGYGAFHVRRTLRIGGVAIGTVAEALPQMPGRLAVLRDLWRSRLLARPFGEVFELPIGMDRDGPPWDGSRYHVDHYRCPVDGVRLEVSRRDEAVEYVAIVFDDGYTLGVEGGQIVPEGLIGAFIEGRPWPIPVTTVPNVAFGGGGGVVIVGGGGGGGSYGGGGGGGVSVPIGEPITITLGGSWDDLPQAPKPKATPKPKAVEPVRVDRSLRVFEFDE